MTNFRFFARLKMFSLSILKIFPLIKPFFKEMFLGGRVPTAGKRRNRLLPVVGLLLMGLLVGGVFSIRFWITNYDRLKERELATAKLLQQLDESNAKTKELRDEISSYLTERKSLLNKNDDLSARISTLERSGQELLSTYEATANTLKQRETELAILKSKPTCPVPVPVPTPKKPVAPKKPKHSQAYLNLLEGNES